MFTARSCVELIKGNVQHWHTSYNHPSIHFILPHDSNDKRLQVNYNRNIVVRREEEMVGNFLVNP